MFYWLGNFKKCYVLLPLWLPLFVGQVTIEEMSRLICSSPALHELSIGSGSSQLTDRLTEKVLQQAVPQTWKGKVLRVESSSPATLKQAFASSQKLSSAKSLVILDSLH